MISFIKNLFTKRNKEIKKKTERTKEQIEYDNLRILAYNVTVYGTGKEQKDFE